MNEQYCNKTIRGINSSENEQIFDMYCKLQITVHGSVRPGCYDGGEFEVKDRNSINDQVGFEIHRTAHMMSRKLETAVKVQGIDEVTLTHGWIIRFLYENRDKDIYQKDIEKYFLVGRSTVANSIKLMEKKGLIRREFVEYDARLKKVLLTEKGIRAHETIEAMIGVMNSCLLEGIDEKDTEVFLKVIRQIKENIENDKSNGKRGGVL